MTVLVILGKAAESKDHAYLVVDLTVKELKRLVIV